MEPFLAGDAVLDKLDAQAVKVILSAQEESRRQGHKFIDTEQLLLGLMCDPHSLPAKILQSFGLKAGQVRQRVNERLGRGNDFVGTETPMAPRLTAVLESACEAAGLRGKKTIGTQELLLGMAHRCDGLAGQILTEAGINTERLVQELEKFEI